ncbi:tyrosine-type recombinase/integrase [Nocardia jiangxiensis]|uniref:tyrosine-type recombinase/integrase n=1 Tax=Nocardia jiangxiensis TaxID=282685 RepID=UPI000593156C|nr:site-specific integrase [Nocardia jiangxiensis]
MAGKRNRRSGVEDRWHKTVYVTQEDGGKSRQTVRSANYGCKKRWRARYVDDQSIEHVRGFERKADAETWLSNQMSSLVQGTHVAPRDAAITVQQWCDQWIQGYEIHRKGTVREAKTHIKRITATFGNMQLSAVRPSSVKAWVAGLKREGLKPSYVYALHGRLSQIMNDAWHEGLIARNPCSRKTSPPMGKQKPYIATTEQVWQLYDACPGHMRVAVLLGAFAGLRVAEVSALRVADIDFMRGVIHPAQQWPADPLKSPTSETPIPIPRELTLLLSASKQRWPHTNMVTNGEAQPLPPWQIERALRVVREKNQVPSLPEEFSFHDLRHYFASLLISKKADVKTVQARLRHASARTTLDTYGHLWPDADESTRTAIGEVIAERMDSVRTTADELRTEEHG